LDSIGRRMGKRRRRMSSMTFKMDVEKARRFAEREMYGRKKR